MRSIRFSLVLMFLLAAAGTMFGQAGATGTISGTISDSSGGVLPNVKVTVTNTATNQAYRTVTTSSGDYTAPSLSPGTYIVAAEAPGFEKSKTTGFTLTVDQKIRIDLSLKPGAVTETLEVTAQAVELDTDTAALSQEMSGDQVASLPLNGRNFMQLLLVGAGAVTVGGEQGTMRQGEGAAVSVNGGRPEGNNYTLDGLVNTDQALVTPAVILSQDAIGEFKVQSGIYPAENGFGASQVNIVSKAGTNSLHGAIFESNRNNAYDAKPFTNASYTGNSPTTNPVLRLNQFGFVVDGPVYIPKIYHGRDKTFFMANYEGWRMNNGQTIRESVPTPAELGGDFSATTLPDIKDANGNILIPSGSHLPAFGTTNCQISQNAGYDCLPADPFTGTNDWGTQVPAADMFIHSPIGKVAVTNGYWGTPTVDGTPEGTANFIHNVGGPLTMNQQTYRGDQNLGKLGSVFGRYTHAKYVNSNIYNSGSINYGLEQYFQTENSWGISHTINLGSRNVNNFRFGKLSASAPEGSVAPPASVISALALTGVFTTFSPLQQSWPGVGLTQFARGGGPGNAYSGSENPNWEFADSFTSVHGKHTLGFGIDYRRWQLIRNLDDDFYGDWSFSAGTGASNYEQVDPNNPNSPSSCNNPASAINGGHPLCGTGNGTADMLIGYVGGVSGYVPGPLSPTTTAGNPQDHIFSALAPYAEDDWKVSQKLSLNIGLRWDYRAAAYEASNHFFWLDTTNTQGGLCYADPALTTNGVATGLGLDNKTPILRYCGKVPHAGSKTPFAPRFGFNYRINDKMVARGGYGIFFDSFEGREIDDSADIYPYSVRNNLSPATVGTQPKLADQMFPSYQTLGPFPQSSLSFIAVIESNNPRNPYVQSWTLSVERELARNTTLEVNYIGTKSTHLLDRRNIAQPNPIPAASLAFCQTQDPTTGKYINATANPCARSYRNPYPNFNGTYINSDFAGYSNYNAMNIKFEHRTHDLAATAIFTWAKSMDDKSAAAGVGATGSGYQGFMDNSRPQLDYAPSDFDVDHRFVASYVYQLPFGRGKKFAGTINRAADIAVGGWQLSGITTFQTGFPFGINGSDPLGLLDSGQNRANYTLGCNIHGSLTKPFQRLNPNCFSNPALGEYGNTSRNFLRQPGINNFDMAIGKDFSFTERLHFLFKMDTFNTFNHHQYGGDVGGLIVAGSGGNAEISNGVGSSTFGQITGASSSRILQFSGKITF